MTTPVGLRIGWEFLNTEIEQSSIPFFSLLLCALEHNNREETRFATGLDIPRPTW